MEVFQLDNAPYYVTHTLASCRILDGSGSRRVELN